MDLEQFKKEVAIIEAEIPPALVAGTRRTYSLEDDGTIGVLDIIKADQERSVLSIRKLNDDTWCFFFLADKVHICLLLDNPLDATKEFFLMACEYIVNLELTMETKIWKDTNEEIDLSHG